jgi:cysteinyl-tRNA synthetase
MEAFEWLKTVQQPVEPSAVNEELDKKIRGLLNEMDDFMNDDFSTARVLANLFELVPVINSLKDKSIGFEALSAGTFSLLQSKMKVYIEDILGFRSDAEGEADKLKGVMQVLIDLRKEARAKKDWMTSDKIRNQLAEIGIQVKDEKDGNMSWSLS